MGYTLYTGQIVEALKRMGHSAADEYEAALHQLTENAGKTLATTLEIDQGPLSELWDGNAAMSFAPSFPGQPIPDEIKGLDTASEWGE